MIERRLEPLPMLGPVQLAQVLPHAAVGESRDGVYVERRRLLADGETAGAARLPRQLEVEPAVARGRGGGGQESVDLHPVVGNRECADSGQRGERLVGGRRPHGGRLFGRRSRVEAVVRLLVGGDVGPPELPLHIEQLAHAVLGRQRQHTLDEPAGLVAQGAQADRVPGKLELRVGQVRRRLFDLGQLLPEEPGDGGDPAGR